MKIINVMNFVRTREPRDAGLEKLLLPTTASQLAAVNELNVDNTFLLLYDALCDDRFVQLFKENATGRTELGLWFEIVRPLTDACGLPYRSENGYDWDWNIIPGYAMGYPLHQREALIDEAMRKFRQTFGHYPKTVGAWVLDTHTVNYLTSHYDISALCICRDQINTDAYTLVGGYFNQAYYPSKNNVFTPAQTAENENHVPVFRLLGPCPIHNYDEKKYASAKIAPLHCCYTLEPAWYTGQSENYVDWTFRTYFQNEDLGFSYAQIGQENSFADRDLAGFTRMQIQHAQKDHPQVVFQKMCDTGEAFRQKYPGRTPATAVTALDNWDDVDVQSVYYDCKNYTANLFRYENRIFLRALYLFDERIADLYMNDVCTTYDAVYENLPIVDTAIRLKTREEGGGVTLDDGGVPFSAKKCGEACLEVSWNDRSVRFTENGLQLRTPQITFEKAGATAAIAAEPGALVFRYKNSTYRLLVRNADITETDTAFVLSAAGPKTVELIPARG